jgi:predicted metal-dependent peptidase
MPEQEDAFRHRGTRAVARMVEFAPATGGLALWIKHCDLELQPEDGRDHPPAETDGRAIHYFPDFERLPLTQQTGLVAHEVLHVALRHPQRYLDLRNMLGDVDRKLFNVCADAIVNSALAHLSWLQLPKSSVFLDQLLKSVLSIDQTAENSLLQWDVERLYRAVDDRHESDPNDHAKKAGNAEKSPGAKSESGDSESERRSAPTRRKSAGPAGQRAARTLAMGALVKSDLVPGPRTQGPPQSQAEEAQLWNERILRAHAGDGEHSMLRNLLADLPKTRTPWEHILRSQLARKLSNQPEVTWSRPSRSYLANQGRIGAGKRMPFEPGQSHNRAVPSLALIIDVSGSISDGLMQRFAREIQSIARRTTAAVTLIVGDNRVRRVEHFSPGRCELGAIEFGGGGGTDFTPLLEEAQRHRPDITVVLTDLDGPANFRPRSLVLWAIPPDHAHRPHPFGRKLTLN